MHILSAATYALMLSSCVCQSLFARMHRAQSDDRTDRWTGGHGQFEQINGNASD